MATATETRSQQDVQKLIFSLEKLGTSSSGSDAPSPSTWSPHCNCEITLEEIESCGPGTVNYIPYLSESEFAENVLPPENFNCNYTDPAKVLFPISAHINEASELVWEETGYPGKVTYMAPLPHINEASQLDCEETDTCFPVSPEEFMLEEPGEGLVRDDRPSEPCNVCSKEHPPLFFCPYKPCDACQQLNHPSNDCPYLRSIPKGARFNKLRYQVVCACGSLFNEEKWACTFCPGHPQLEPKYCSMCNAYKKHCEYECPMDEVAAAE